MSGTETRKSVPLFSQYDIETVNVRFEFAYRK